MNKWKEIVATTSMQIRQPLDVPIACDISLYRTVARFYYMCRSYFHFEKKIKHSVCSHYQWNRDEQIWLRYEVFFSPYTKIVYLSNNNDHWGEFSILRFILVCGPVGLAKNLWWMLFKDISCVFRLEVYEPGTLTSSWPDIHTSNM